jgi:hypothetical protein
MGSLFLAPAPLVALGARVDLTLAFSRVEEGIVGRFTVLAVE